MAVTFETTECSRCGGVGRYSHNGEHDRCYGCGGTGVQYTKAGRAAREAYNEIARPTVSVMDVQAGQRIRITGIDGKTRAHTVVSVTDDGDRVGFRFPNGSGYYPFKTGTVQMATTDESIAAAIKATAGMPGITVA